ncbi:MAG: DNA topoisomerase, partial [Candidatus Nanoarchaeia archaeon]
MPYELIVTEKPSAAKKIAEALDNGKPVKENNKGVPYYKVTHGNKDIIVTCAVGHLYSVAEKNKGKWTYPVFEIEWKAAGEARKDAAYSKKYLATIKKLSKEADEFTIATDYDIEGEVIGWNIIRFACKQKDANRMKFSTLTKPDIIKAYDSKSKHLDWGQAHAGETRHFLDWMYGINLSRALSLAIKKAANRHHILSAGRVQGPALKTIVEREKDINAFIPEPYWQIEIAGVIKAGEITALHEKDK